MNKHEPTKETRAQIQALSGFGIQEPEIAKYIGIDPKTLRKYYRQELDVGHIHANAQVARSLYNQAVGGNTTAAIFWLKARAGFSERLPSRDPKILKRLDELEVEKRQAEIELIRRGLPSGKANELADVLAELADRLPK